MLCRLTIMAVLLGLLILAGSVNPEAQVKVGINKELGTAGGWQIGYSMAGPKLTPKRQIPVTGSQAPLPPQVMLAAAPVSRHPAYIRSATVNLKVSKWQNGS